MSDQSAVGGYGLVAARRRLDRGALSEPGPGRIMVRVAADTGRALARQALWEPARVWLLAAAEAGDRGARLELGCLLVDIGELEESESWLRHGAEEGHPASMFHLGRLLLFLERARIAFRGAAGARTAFMTVRRAVVRRGAFAGRRRRPGWCRAGAGRGRRGRRGGACSFWPCPGRSG